MERDPVFDIGLPTNLDLSLPDSAVEVSREFTTRVARLAIRFHELNEAPPLEALVAAFCEHLDIDADLLRMIVFEEAVEETLAEVENRDAEIEMLNNLWSDSPDE
jgi:3-dehydroquinate dehydratase